MPVGLFPTICVNRMMTQPLALMAPPPACDTLPRSKLLLMVSAPVLLIDPKPVVALLAVLLCTAVLFSVIAAFPWAKMALPAPSDWFCSKIALSVNSAVLFCSQTAPPSSFFA